MTRQELAEQIVAQQALVQALKEYSRLAYLQYDGGYAPYTDVLQAEQQLFPAELNLAAARTALLASVVRIYQATGGGWVDIAAEGGRRPPEGAGERNPSPRSQRPDRSRDGRRRVCRECLPRAGQRRSGGARAEKRLAAAGSGAAARLCSRWKASLPKGQAKS